jgi:hypothetical protein
MQRHTKLNSLQRTLPDGLVVDAAWLEKHGYSRALRNKYVAHGWLDQVARGVYRPVDQLSDPVLPLVTGLRHVDQGGRIHEETLPAADSFRIASPNPKYSHILLGFSALLTCQNELLSAHRSTVLRPELAGTPFFFSYDQQTRFRLP